jgi:hypothetical protein
LLQGLTIKLTHVPKELKSHLQSAEPKKEDK